MSNIFYTLCLWLSLCSVAVAATGDDADPVSPLPAVSPDANSYSRTRTFLKSEDADRFEEQFYGFVETGCTHPVPGSGYVATMSTPCTAYPGGYRVNDTTATINYSTWGAAATDVCWLAVSAAASGNSGNFVRVSSSHFLVDCTSATRPSAPTDGVIAAKVTITGGSISAVQDLRRLSPVITYALHASFSGVVLAAGDFAYASDTECLYVGDGSTTGGNVVGCAVSGGDVVGPDGATADSHACFDGITGKLLKECTGSVGGSSGCDIHITVEEFADSGALLYWTRYARDCSYPEDLAGSTMEAWGNGAFAEAVVNIYKVADAICNPVDYNPGSPVFTGTFPADLNDGTGVFAGSATDFDEGDCIYIEAPDPADSNLGPYGIWIKGEPQ